jgi:dipeptidyl aminopeptidase/acylaminoacyl peptidase
VGDHLLVSFAPGGLLSVPLSGAPTPLIDAAQAAAPADAVWSPTGDAIAFLDPAVDGARTGLYVAPTGATPLDPVPVVTSSQNRPRSVSGFAWLPDGSGLLFAEADIDNRVATGGDLFQISPSGENPRLVAGAGAAAPVARIARFAPSPAGGAVAYTVVAPGPDGPSFHSLWVQQLGTGARYRLPVPDREAVTDLWWTAEGLVWRTVAIGDAAADSTYAAGPFALYRADSSAPPERLAEVDPVPAASPVASPAASPKSLPVASPAGA